MKTQEQSQALMDGYVGLLDDLPEDECDARTVEIICAHIKDLLEADYPLRPVVTGTHRDTLEGIKDLWEQSGYCSNAIPEYVETICRHATPRYGSGW